eukprot:m.70481 g.70481  ORF g.70481 m.70481 type:complete len:52 (-) comp7882_c0_seq1:265-420(-)
MFWSPITTSDVAWNFEKFLVDRKGVPRTRYANTVNPSNIVPDIERLLAERA